MPHVVLYLPRPQAPFANILQSRYIKSLHEVLLCDVVSAQREMGWVRSGERSQHRKIVVYVNSLYSDFAKGLADGAWGQGRYCMNTHPI